VSPVRHKTEYLRIGELAEAAGVSVATIKYYIREGLLPPPSVKTGRTMAYYDQAYLERLRAIRTLREEHFLPVRVIRTLLAQRGDAPLGPAEAAVLARIGPAVLARLDPEAEPEAALTRAELGRRFKLSDEELTLLEEIGIVGEKLPGGKRRYGRADVELLEAMRRAEDAGLTRERFPFEGLGHYVELLGELGRREVRIFTKQAERIPAAELEQLADVAIQLTEPVVALIRRKLILRALRSELRRGAGRKKEEKA
jgi:DNA-binding transcriptional MerR regulator